MLREFAGFHAAGNYTGAALLANELIKLSPRHPEGHYNLACALARLHQTDEALYALEQSIDNGCRWIEHLQIDPDLDGLRDSTRFQALLERVSRLIEEETISPQPLREDGWEKAASELQSNAPQLLARYQVPSANIVLIHNGECVWNHGFHAAPNLDGDVSPANTVSIDNLCRLRRPVDLLALVAAAQQEKAGELDLSKLLAQADEIGLRDYSKRSRRNGEAHHGGRAVLAGLTTPSTLTFDSAEAVAIDWSSDSAVPGTSELIALAIELTCDQSFTGYCEKYIFEPAEVVQTSLVSKRLARAAQRRAKSSDSGPGGLLEQCDDSNAPVWIVGHTRLGTTIDQRPLPDGLTLQTTPQDFAALIAQMTDAQTPGFSSSIERMSASAKLTPGGLGLGIDIKRNADGVQMQLAEVSDGVGVLARWYPRTGQGVVIFFNSENGPDAALRIAHIALGGS